MSMKLSWCLGVGTVLVSILLLSAEGQAAFDLRITEIWSGQDGPDLSPDWAEVTNVGNMAWTTADGDLYVEDDSGNGGASGLEILVQGISSIGPGEVAIILMEGEALDAGDFKFYWDLVKEPDLSLSLIGYAAGSGIGLGGGGDTVNLFLGDARIHLDSEGYDDAPSGISWDVGLQAYSAAGNASGAMLLAESETGFGDNIASPGMTSVPEPTTMLLIGIGVAGLLVGRRRK